MSKHTTPTRLNILIYVCSCILLIVGGFTLPVRPDTVMVGDTKVSGMTENEYINFLVKTPPFHCIIAGIILFAAGLHYSSMEFLKNACDAPYRPNKRVSSTI